MAQWKKDKIQRENGETVDAQFPVIVSASRSTDIPAFYADWFFHRLKIGYSAWRNPFNGVNSYVSYKDTRFIVFWSKNPKPLLQHLDYLKERDINCYIQYTLNDYVAEGLERGVPSVEERIETFKTLVERLGKGRVVWRFDPLILTDKISIDDLLRKIERTVKKGKLNPKAIIAVDLFGLPADFKTIRQIAQRYGLFLLEDA
ncbi:MAG: DUF1848 family protein, partial [Bacteroidaceae bacterium]|nr:DUF1848 family protein [Bacteroidaceae bacterium]